jgi:hypothetical protein
MKIARYRRAKQENAVKVCSRGFANPLHKLVNFLVRNHCILASLPTAAGATAPGTASPKAAESAASAKTATTSEPASTTKSTAAPSAASVSTTAASEYLGEQQPKQEAA